MVGKHVVMVHAQNSEPTPEGSPHPWSRALIQDGVVDYPYLLGLLRGWGFDGYVEVEFVKGDGDRERMMDSLKKDAAYLKKITAEASM